MIDRIGYLEPSDVADSTGTSAVANRAVGDTAPTDLIDRSTGDTRYVQLNQATAPTYTAPTISNPPTQSDVQAIANALASLITALQATHTLT